MIVRLAVPLVFVLLASACTPGLAPGCRVIRVERGDNESTLLTCAPRQGEDRIDRAEGMSE